MMPLKGTQLNRGLVLTNPSYQTLDASECLTVWPARQNAPLVRTWETCSTVIVETFLAGRG